MGTTVLAPTGPWMAGIREHTYWVPPLYFLAQAAWYLIFGISLDILRALSIAWGVLALLACYLITKRLTGSAAAALVAAALTATDYRFLLYSPTGRMDMMSAALGFAGLAVFLILRQNNWRWALLLSHALAAASCLTHPCGVLHAAGLTVLMAMLDRARLPSPAIALATLPYLAGLAGWGAYISQDPHAFRNQLRGNISGVHSEMKQDSRFSTLGNPVWGLKQEVGRRYLLNFGSYAGWKEPMGFQLGVFAVYAGSILLALTWKRIRHYRHTSAALALGLAYFLILWLFDGLRSSAYLVHVIPLIAILTAITLRRLPWRPAASLTLAVLFSLQLLAASLEIARRERALYYDPVAELLRSQRKPGEQVIASAELGFATGFPDWLIDDVRLGYMVDRPLPAWIVLARWHKSWHKVAEKRDPRLHRYIGNLLRQEYKLVLQTPAYDVHRLLRSPSR
jgi:4-amino-4-deoxy-L-arabinose transferase-like glycosyltransferase